MVTSTWVFDGQGGLEEYVGGYQDYLLQRQQQQLIKSRDKTASGSQNPTVVSATATTTISKKVKLSYKDQRELDSLPDLIAALEAEQTRLEQQLADGSLFTQNPDAATVAVTRLSAIEQELLDTLDRWTALEAASQGD